ncbi:MAG: CUB domain-containing protein [Bacteroidia bacterium]
MKAIKKIILFCAAFLSGIFHLHGQSYNMANGTQNVCAGTFYDNGGAGSNYTNTNFTETFCSSSGNCLSVNFTSFQTQAGNDILTIYDGPNNTYPVIGSYSGNNSPGLVVSSSGCLTFKFTTNVSGTRPGWAATIACATCSTILSISTMANSVSTCDATFYDPGGAAGNYGNNQSFTKTICSSVAGQCVSVQFTSFDVKAGDYLYIWDGANTSAPLIRQFTNAGPPSLQTPILASSGCLTFRFVSNNTNVGAGWSAIVSCEPCPTPPAGVATYTLGTTSLQNTYLVNQMVNTCSGTFTDNGGLAANYSNNIGGANGYYRTFCPSQVGKCLRAQFWSFSTEAGFDYLSIRNGPTQLSPAFGTGSSFWGTAGPNTYQGCMAAGIGPYTSTDQSGCITFSFHSDFITTYPGWVVTFDCVPCNYGPNGTDNNDCSRASLVCSDLGFGDASTGPGLLSETGPPGCALSENYSNWYKFQVKTSGTLGLNIIPVVASDDYDFALFGPNVSCGSLGSPVRCSYASNTGNTGLNSALNLTTNTAVCGTPNNGSDVSEDVCGNAWVNNINVTAGQIYYLMVNKWTPGGNGFTLNWVLTGGASLQCTPLPVQWLNFSATPENHTVNLNWSTASEYNNDHFEIERSNDGRDFHTIAKTPSRGYSTAVTEYNAIDLSPLYGTSYYRIKQVDINGEITFSKIVLVSFLDHNEFISIEPNPASTSLVNVGYNLCQNESGFIEVYDTKGIRKISSGVSGRKGFNKRQLDISQLQPGIYVLIYLSESVKMQQRLVIK